MRPQEWQSLSAYIDNQLSPREKAALEKRLAKNPDLQKALEELRQTKSLLHKLPNIRVPRNFTLSPDMVTAQKPAIGQLFPIFSLSSALATVLLVVSIVFQWGIGTSPLNMQAKMESADMITANEMAAEVEEAPPAIILWGEQDYSPEIATGKGGGGGDEPAPSMMNEAPEMLAVPMDEEPAAEARPIEEQLTAPEAEIPRAAEAEPKLADEALEDAQPQTESLQIEESAPQTMEAAPLEPSARQQYDEGPILGIPSEDEAGQIILPTQDLGENQPETRSIPTPLPILQILLGILAVASGVAAFLIRRKNLL